MSNGERQNNTVSRHMMVGIPRRKSALELTCYEQAKKGPSRWPSDAYKVIYTGEVCLPRGYFGVVAQNCLVKAFIEGKNTIIRHGTQSSTKASAEHTCFKPAKKGPNCRQRLTGEMYKEKYTGGGMLATG